MLIHWSEEDGAYVVSFSKFPGAHTHGQSYVEAVKSGQEVLALLIETFEPEGMTLPQPALFQSALV